MEQVPIRIWVLCLYRKGMYKAGFDAEGLGVSAAS